MPYNTIINPSPIETHKNLFRVVVEYEHGDADATTTSTFLLVLTPEQMAEYYEAFMQLAAQIEEASSNGEEFEDQGVIIHGHRIECDRDVMYDGHTACMSIVKITYFDENGQEHAVEMEECEKD